ncbi:hypothetical protein NLI96_g802 [Meripilus lineatus]|uniref:WW domain-containing protein n=1 Tax=Meripilus lineatus TaxID=2056292 RepID=A0AAD5VBP8_9APHY|nr:hypothetical protein NLI96_g802 [Physisporinus lineatus]
MPLGSSLDLPHDAEYPLTQIHVVDTNDEKTSSGGTTIAQDGSEIVRPMYPTMVVERYNRNTILPQHSLDYKYVIPRLTTRFDRDHVPHGWIACVHPEGSLYYYKENQRVYTDANVCDTVILREVECFLHALEKYAEEEFIKIPPKSELVIELTKPDGGEDLVWEYYYVNPESRTLFWLHDFDVTWWLSELIGETSPPHIKHEIERYFWTHLEYFPHGHTLDDHLVRELTDVLIHALADRITSSTSTVPFSAEHVNKMLSITKDIQGTLRFGPLLLETRLTSSTKPKDLPIILFASSVKFLCSHNSNSTGADVSSHYKLDFTVYWEPWKLFIDSVVDEWHQSLLGASMTLLITVVFLSFSGFTDASTSRSPGEILAFISGALCLGSVVLSNLLRRQHGNNALQPIEQAAGFLFQATQRLGGTEMLAAVYTLPYVLMLWGILVFLAAFSYECFVTSDRAALIASGVVWGIITVTVVGSLFVVSPPWSFPGSRGLRWLLRRG